MKKLSFANKLTIWYSAILLIISIGSMLAMSEMGKRNVKESSMTILVEKVSETEEKIAATGRDFEFSRGLDFYSDDVYISVYDKDGNLIEGKWPAGVTEKPEFGDRQQKTVVDSSGDEWYIYDGLCNEDGRIMWIRGITAGKYSLFSSGFVWHTALLSLIGLVLIALFVGRYIAVRSLSPIRNLNGTVEEIRRSGDLSKRVEQQSKDDLGQLAENFNGLFDRVETMVDKEKQFTADISHELKTPLAVIASQSEYALEDEEYREQALRAINSEAKRMSEMIGRLRLLAGSDSNNLKLHMERVNFSELCNSILEQQKLIGKESDVNITGDIEENVFVNADTTMIIRAILNLMDNGIKYAGPGSCVSISLHEEAGDAVCVVSDNGPGINSENIDKIWDRFYREDKSRHNRESWGLGLSMVKAIVEAHGGAVGAESIMGKGCSFTIRLPRKENDDD